MSKKQKPAEAKTKIAPCVSDVIAELMHYPPNAPCKFITDVYGPGDDDFTTTCAHLDEVAHSAVNPDQGKMRAVVIRSSIGIGGWSGTFTN